jgi:hypothetical protein
VVDLEHLDGFINPPYPQTFDAAVIYLAPIIHEKSIEALNPFSGTRPGRSARFSH